MYLLRSGFVQRDKVVSFIENRTKFVKKGKGTDFHTAVIQMDQFIADSVVCMKMS